MDLNKLALLNSIAEEKAELEKKGKMIKREVDFIEYTKKYTEIIENLIYNNASNNKKRLTLWVDDNSDSRGKVYEELDSGNVIGNKEYGKYKPIDIDVECSCLPCNLKEFDSKQDGDDKLKLINEKYPRCSIKYLALSNVISILNAQGFHIDWYHYSSGMNIWIEWTHLSPNGEYTEDNYDVENLKEKYKRVKELNEMASNVIAD